MLKAPARSKRRLAATFGNSASEIAAQLLDCALADVDEWPGPTCLAPSSPEDRDWLDNRGSDGSLVVEQGPGNLGERIESVNRVLLERGFHKQIFIGIDCPGIDDDYLRDADSELEARDVVIGPAVDGGCVLMGVHGQWPRLADLPWSTDTLLDGLLARCRNASKSVATLDTLQDLDTADDVTALRHSLGADLRPTRAALAVTLSRLPGAAD